VHMSVLVHRGAVTHARLGRQHAWVDIWRDPVLFLLAGQQKPLCIGTVTRFVVPRRQGTSMHTQVMEFSHESL
jgi:hypothetical protein